MPVFVMLSILYAVSFMSFTNKPFMLSVVLLNVVMLCVVLLSVIAPVIYVQLNIELIIFKFTGFEK
jgi:hypothetical protein